MITAESVLAGPHGRRFLLQLAQELDDAAPDAGPNLRWRVMSLAQTFGSDQPVLTASRLIGDIEDPRALPQSSVGDVRQALDALVLGELTEELVRQALSDTVARSTPWQEPDADAIALTHPDLHDALLRLAAWVETSGLVDWWDSGPALDDQWHVQFSPSTLPSSAHGHPHDPERVLTGWEHDERESARRAARELPRDPRAPYTGSWWSTPPGQLLTSTRSLFDGAPAELYFFEDGAWEDATVRRLSFTKGDGPDADVYAITCAADWVALCNRYPLDVTPTRRHDWYRSLGKDWDWVIPNWAAVAKDYAGAHLSVSAYVTSAGRALPLSEGQSPEMGAPRGSAITGWGPDTTYWFTPTAEVTGATHNWRFSGQAGTSGGTWIPG